MRMATEIPPKKKTKRRRKKEMRGYRYTLFKL
jgi:hypothetical protein